MNIKTPPHEFSENSVAFKSRHTEQPRDASQRLLRLTAPRARDIARVTLDYQPSLTPPLVKDIRSSPADARLIHALGIDFCLTHGVLPLRKMGAVNCIAVESPKAFETHRVDISAVLGPVVPIWATRADIEHAILNVCSAQMVKNAETKTDIDLSCRQLKATRIKSLCLSGILVLLAALIFAPMIAVPALIGLALFLLICASALKLAAFIVSFRAPVKTSDQIAVLHPPTVSILVPLFKETDITTDLLRRLKRLSYPKHALDICFVVEHSDITTQKTFADTQLPHWMRCISVPDGSIKTKPRAMNFALGFCRGSIIGIYDAEDNPDPDQIEKVVKRFANAPADVACLQGVLDFYNSRANWMSRCFTIEYAMWFRTILPALARMGLVVPLGGTTLFFRRDILEKLGGWDAHNVTEDADLGVRLSRAGYRTEVINTTTFEEANCAAWPWVKQRSRWLKGYAMTYIVHMLHPVKLQRELGWKRFWGFQILFGGTILQFLLAPLLWSFWALILFGFHPFDQILSPDIVWNLFILFMAAEVINIAVAIRATRSQHHTGLWPWILTLGFYFPLATAAVIKAIYEMTTCPFYWDKTAHGKSPKSQTH